MPWGLRTCDGPNADLTRSLNLSQPPMLPVWVSCVGLKPRGGWDLRSSAKTLGALSLLLWCECATGKGADVQLYKNRCYDDLH